PFTESPLVVVEVNPSELNRLMAALLEAELNINYLYSFIPQPDGKPVIGLNMEDNETAEQALRRHQFRTLKQAEISRGLIRYLVKARVKRGCERALAKAIEDKTLGQGSIAGEEYLYDMEQARVAEDGTAHWVETCFCPTPLQEERPYWEKYFDLLSVKDA